MKEKGKLGMFVDIKVKTNPLHNTNYYLDMDFAGIDVTNAKMVFEEIAQNLNKPLQIMISSEEVEKIEILKAADFICKRKCYEVEAERQDYIGANVECEILYSSAGEEMYEQCCELMLNRYILAHRNVNPWTGTKEEFFSELPECVAYSCMDGKIVSFALVEEDEIAYVYGENVQVFHKFAQALVTDLFQKYEVITFEADDCDEIAMELKNMFINQSEESFDTYIRER